MQKEQKKLVVIIPMPGIYLLDVAGPSDVFMAADKALDENPNATGAGYELLLASPIDSNRIVTKSGIAIDCPVLASEINTPIDTLIVCGFSLCKCKPGTRFFNG